MEAATAEPTEEVEQPAVPKPEAVPDPGDGAGGGPLHLTVAAWFSAAALLLVLPRQWISAAAAAVIAGIVVAAGRRRGRA